MRPTHVQHNGLVGHAVCAANDDHRRFEQQFNIHHILKLLHNWQLAYRVMVTSEARENFSHALLFLYIAHTPLLFLERLDSADLVFSHLSSKNVIQENSRKDLLDVNSYNIDTQAEIFRPKMFAYARKHAQETYASDLLVRENFHLIPKVYLRTLHMSTRCYNNDALYHVRNSDLFHFQ